MAESQENSKACDILTCLIPLLTLRSAVALKTNSFTTMVAAKTSKLATTGGGGPLWSSLKSPSLEFCPYLNCPADH